jgi:hypothetical protein
MLVDSRQNHAVMTGGISATSFSGEQYRAIMAKSSISGMNEAKVLCLFLL